MSVLAMDTVFSDQLQRHREILSNWIIETNDQGQYPENIEGLKFMYEIWGDKCVNPEYDTLKSIYYNQQASI